MENDSELKQLVKKFFYYLDIVEESDSGRVFKPNQISSCRVMDSKNMGEILARMKEIIGEEK